MIHNNLTLPFDQYYVKYNVLLLAIAQKINKSYETWYHDNGLHGICNICSKNFDLTAGSVQEHAIKHVKESKLVAFI